VAEPSLTCSVDRAVERKSYIYQHYNRPAPEAFFVHDPDIQQLRRPRPA
jgi:hypothetical protein